MHQLWDSIILPVLQTVHPQCIIEIGTEDGKCTEKLLTFLEKNGGMLHSIDPDPLYSNPSSLHVQLHRGSSLDVLPTLPDADIVLIDGDHNWYTVFHELQLLATKAKRSGRFPVVILHDTGWPYGRRDVYYSPERIPEAYRHPIMHAGLPCPGAEDIVINTNHWHSRDSNSPQNGVRTAVEDFLTQTDLLLEHVFVPGLHGVAILADARSRIELPALFSLLHRLQCSIEQEAHIGCIERERIREAGRRHSFEEEAAQTRHQLAVTKAAMETVQIQYCTLRIEHIRSGTQARMALWQESHTQNDLQYTLWQHTSLLSRVIDTLQHTKQHLFALQRSRSWRWTAPVRALEYRLRRLRRTAVQQQSVSVSAVDILIPIHNAFQETFHCISSVLAHTMHPHRILLLDDGSTDPTLTTYLRQIARMYPERILLLRSDETRGFIRTVNRGIALSQNDVVLLNSDTLVPRGWLARLALTAKTKRDAGSITALSNTCSLYSVLRDKAWAPYPHPEHINHLQAALDTEGPAQTPAIPTGVGFCLYLRREALERIGLFDESFGVGYGEENDWCMRASRHGYKHYLDDSVFVYHKGQASMVPAGHIQEGQSTITEHEELLQKRHPHYSKRIRRFQKHSSCLISIQKRTEAAWQSACNRTHVAYLVHHNPYADHFGGTAYHVEDLAQSLQNSMDITILYPLKGHLGITQILCGKAFHSVLPANHSAISSLVPEVLRAVRPDVFHVHHTIGTHCSVLTEAAALGIPTVFTVHDFYTLDPGINLLNGMPHPMHICPEAPEYTYGQWQQMHRNALSSVQHIIAPSKSALEIFDSVFFDVPAARHVIPHGWGNAQYPIATDHPQTIDVCFLGSVAGRHKGKSVISTVAKLLADAGLHVGVLGAQPEQFADMQSDRITCFGRYRREVVLEKLYAINPKTVALLSQWPETFCYTLSEAWAAGIPVFATDTGALGERIAGTGCGQLSQATEPEDIARELIDWVRSPKCTQARSSLLYMPLKTRDAMADEYRTLYERITQ